MRRGRTTALAAAFVLLPGAALAHAPIPGVGAFWNGVVHPLLVPSHMLVLAAVGILLGQHAPRLSRLGWPTFAAALGIGVAFAGGQAVPLTVFLAVAAAGGGLVAVGRPLAGPVVVVALAGAVAVGLDSAPDGAAAGEKALALAGAFAGALLVVTLLGGLVARLRRSWQTIAARAVGSWIAAASILVLAFTLSRGGLA